MAALSSVNTRIASGQKYSHWNTGLQSVTVSGISTAEIATTALSSTDTECVMGSRDGGEIEFELLVDSTVAIDQPVPGYRATIAEDGIVIIFGGNVAAGIPGLVMNFALLHTKTAIAAEVDGALRVTYTGRIQHGVNFQLA